MASLKLTEKVLKIGIVADEQLAWLYDHAKVFVFPSDYEGFGLPLAEALCRGTPVIARNASAMAEIVAEAGVLVETRSPKNLCEALKESQRNRSELQSLARARSVEFTRERMIKKIESVYEKALVV